MAGKKWTFLRRFKALNYWNKVSIALGVLGIPALILAIWGIWLVYNPPKIQLKESQKTEIENFGGNPSEIQRLMQDIQDERNKAINDLAQIEFIDVISNIYKTLDTSVVIKLNETTIDSLTGDKYRSDVIIEKELLGTKVKVLLRLNPYENPLGILEIESFHKHLLAIKASKGVIISKGKYSRSGFLKAKKLSIDLIEFISSKKADWSGRIEIPLVIRVLTPRIKTRFYLKRSDLVGGDNSKSTETFSKYMEKGYITKDFGKTKIHISELFIKKWERGEIPLTTLKGELRINNHDWSLLTKEALVPLGDIIFEYTIDEEYRYNYIKPIEYISLKNLRNNSTFYSAADFSNIFNDSTYMKIENWRLIDNKTRQTFNQSEIATISGLSIMGYKEWDPQSLREAKFEFK